MSNHLFLFTLGPVQSFIAQARKTQDLYAGSRLLSVLTDTAIKTVEQNGGNIIFPKPDLASLPNRFIAKVDLPENSLQGFGQQVEDAVRAEWRSIALNTLMNNKLFAPSIGFWEQIEQHLEIYWVFTPISDEPNGYKNAFQEIDRLLAGVKQTTHFGQNKEIGRKCSVDGQRNVKFYRRSEGQRDKQKKPNKDLRNSPLHANDNVIFDYENPGIALSLLQPGEGLSGVSMVKRSYKPNGTSEFPSTADIALLKSIHFWEKPSSGDDYKNYKKAFEGVHFDAQLLFEDNLTEQYFKKQSLNKVLEKKKLPDLKELLQKFKGKSPYPQTKYYAILLFDGDGMGELLSGERLKNPQHLEKFHGVFSEKLGDFAEAAKDYLDDKEFARGRTVYAGGDDFLGFVNLESLFDVLAHFQCKFRELVATPMQPYLKDVNGITFSAGICIAHYKEPLSLILNRARAMEQKAKDYRKSKNAFGIAVIKGSGEDHDTVWGFETDSVTKLKFLVDAMRGTDANFSNNFIKNFQVELRQLLDPKGNIEVDVDLLRTELKRLIARSVNSEFHKDKKQILRDELLTKIWDELFINQQSYSSLQNFFEMLNICDFLHRTLNPVKEKANA